MSDPINHPKHYTSHPSGIEAIDVCEKQTFCLGNAIKYLFRTGKKNDALEDLKKSAWYLTRAIRNDEKLAAPIPSMLLDVRFEPEGSVLGDVLHLLADGNAIGALRRVEGEIKAEVDNRHLE